MDKHILDILKQYKNDSHPILNKELLTEILNSNNPEVDQQLQQAAQTVRLNNVGPFVYYRGLIEISNYCMKNCFYCGLRIDNKNTARYTMDFEDVKRAVEIAWKSNMGSLVIQSGEMLTPKFYDYLGQVLKHILSLLLRET